MRLPALSGAAIVSPVGVIEEGWLVVCRSAEVAVLAGVGSVRRSD